MKRKVAVGANLGVSGALLIQIGSLTLPNGVVTKYTYDAASQLGSLTYKKAGNTLGNLTYEYDSAGRRVRIGGSFARTNLPAALTSVSNNAANQQTGFGGQTLGYDLNGNLTGDGTNTYTWNARDELVSISGSLAASFQYDAVGRRHSKTIGGSNTNFLYGAPSLGSMEYFSSYWKNYLGCGLQTDHVTYDLKRNKYESNWTFETESRLLPFPHQWGKATSNNPDDPVIIYDPWNDDITCEKRR